MLCLSGFELYSRWVPLLQSSMNAKVKRIKPDFAFDGSVFKL